MDLTSLLRVARLGDHLGLAMLCEAAAEVLVQMPWEESVYELTIVLEMPVYKLDAEKKVKLLHHPQRGIYAEIQVLELPQQISTPETDIAELLRIASLQPQELLALLRILSHADRTPGPLLAKAVKQHVWLRPGIDWNTCTRFAADIGRPSGRKWQVEYGLPRTDVALLFNSSYREGKTVASANAAYSSCSPKQ